MATLTKPKLKKKHKEETNDVLEEPEEVNIEPLLLDGIDIDFPTTSLRDEIPSYDCFVANQGNAFNLTDKKNTDNGAVECVESDENVGEAVDIDFPITALRDGIPSLDCFIANKGASSSVDIKNADVREAIQTSSSIKDVDKDRIEMPSAPILTDIIEEPTAPIEIKSVARHQIVAYPNLESMKNIEAIVTRAKSMHTPNERILLKPFTQQQLNEFYINTNLPLAQSFEQEFIDNELKSNYKDHILYELLMKYSKSRYNLKINLMDLQNFKKIYQQNCDGMWEIETRNVNYSGTCQDKVLVNAKTNYEFAIVNERIFETVFGSLTDLLNLIQYNYTLCLYATNVYRVQIEQYICELLTCRAEFMKINRQSPARLKQEIDGNLLESIRQLRIAISILFDFMRKPMPDKIFSNDIKSWLQKLIAIHLRMATWRDHLFLLFHVLRCPPGIASWAMPLIQVPAPLLNASINGSNEINYCMIFLKILMIPIKMRKEFLAQLLDDNNLAVDAMKTELWVLVDSDGEDDHDDGQNMDGLKENDLVCLLNQIPLEKLFGAMTFTNFNKEKCTLDEKFITGQHLLRFIAFATNFIELLGNGLKTYDTEKYKQFAKMLCRLIRHTVLYVSDMHKIFVKNKTNQNDPQTCTRIQIEYDAFVLRASCYIYKSRFLGTWQYLAILPFDDLYIENAWKLYYSLSVGFVDNIIENIDENFMQKTFENEFMEKFNDTIIDIPAEDMYYLLQTFSSIAMARNECDIKFIQRITLDLFKIGFINKPTKESCYKIVKDLLGNITLKYPQLITSILMMLRDNFQLNDTGNIYLFKSLPLNQWRPSLADFEIAAAWLLNFSYETPENSLARAIFSRLNWSFDNNNELFLPHDIHIRTACLIAQVSSKHVPELIGASGISESVRQVSNLVSTQTPKQQFTTWCWNMISVLRLHCLDLNQEIIIQTLHNPNESFKLIPELERIQPIFEGVSDSRPLALYLSVLCSMWGHSVPQICHKGFIQLQLLLNDYRHSIVIRCLHLIAPLFLECAESLSQCDKFQSILTQILTSDRTYLRMAKDLIVNDNPSIIVELFGNMIQAQLINYYNYGLQSPTLLVNLWLQCLTYNSNWVKDSNALYVVDLILSVAYQFPDSWISAREYFRFLHMQVDEIKVAKVSSFIPFLGGSRPNGPFPVPSNSYLWLSYMILELEHEIFELNTKFWAELLHELQTISGKFSMDSVVKKCAGIVNCSTTTANALTIYKLANLILNCSYEHPLLPIVCQKFFYLYLARIEICNDEVVYAEKFGVSNLFYDSNVSLMKKLKKFFADVEKFYNETSLKTNDIELSQFYSNCSKLFRSYGIWLEEDRLNKIPNLKSESSFPPQYNLSKLELIFARNETPWNEYLKYSEIRTVQKEAANNFLKSCFRYNVECKIPTSSTKDNLIDNPIKNIIRHLQSYDSPIKAAEIVIEQPPIEIDPKLNLLSKNLQKNFTKLNDAAKQFDMNVNEVKSLDCNYKELIRLLYTNQKVTVNRMVRCSSILFKQTCSGQGSVAVNIFQPILNDIINGKIANNRERYDKIIDDQFSTAPHSIVMAIVEIHHFIRQILDINKRAKRNKDESNIKSISDIGIKFFYTVVNGLNEHLNIFPPANELCAQALSNLGILIQQNQSTEGINLLQAALRRPNLVKLISDLFIPSTTSPIYFLEMYKFIVDSHMRKCDAKILFVLLSKFDIPNWLTEFKPKLCDISLLLRYIVQGLECWNQNDAVLIQGVLRRHLVHIFEYEFPEHYGEVIQLVIDGSSDQKLMPCVLRDLINSIYKLANCNELQIDGQAQQSAAKLKEDIINFATTQKLLSFKEIQDTMALLARHFQNERLQHGLHGLYPKHKNYCDIIALLFKSLGYSVVVAAVHAYPGVLADNIVEWLWPSICDMFSPWLVPYFPQNNQNLPANWIKQIMANNQVLLPWSELHIDNAQKILHTFIDCIQFVMDTLPANVLQLGNIFYWYEIHYAHISVPRHVLKPIHASLTLLPWNRFHSTPVHINCIYRILQQFLPECHTFTGHIFLRVNWTQWLHNNLPTWDYVTRQKVLSMLLMIFVKFAYEPHVRENSHFLTLILEAATYPWHFVDYQGIESMFEWFNTSTEPSIILRLRSEHGAVDTGVLSLLQVVSAMIPTLEHHSSESQIHAKHILYVKNVVRMLRICGSRHHQLLSTAEGLSSYHAAVVDLIDMIEAIVATNKSNLEAEAINLLMEIICSLQTHREYTSNIFVNAIVIWQSKSKIGSPVLCNTINAIGMCKQLTKSLIMLLEATIFNYFRSLESTRDYHNPSWQNIMDRIGGNLPQIELKDMICDSKLLTLHLVILYKMKSFQMAEEKIGFLQKIYHMLEKFKTCDQTEPKLAIIWAIIISSGYKYLQTNSHSQNQLLTLGRYLQTISNNSDGWGEGLLEAIGLKKDFVTKKRRILTRCLSCIVFSLFPDKSNGQSIPCQEYNVALEELITTIHAKKYADIRATGLLAVDIIERQQNDLTKLNENICRILRLFYQENYLNTIEGVWATI